MRLASRDDVAWTAQGRDTISLPCVFPPQSVFAECYLVPVLPVFFLGLRTGLLTGFFSGDIVCSPLECELVR